MDLKNAQYTFDTNVFIHLKNYPKDLFPTIWEISNRDFLNGKILIIQDVVDELSRIDDEIFEYAKTHKDNIFELDEKTQKELIKVLRDFPNWISPIDNRNQADPCLVATGLNLNVTVITQERVRGNELKIPLICNHYGVECGDFYDYLRDKEISF
ncbi:MAG: DUF4411 family protein [Promethearchaeia archaeon]